MSKFSNIALVFCITFMLCINLSIAQEAQFSQFYASSLFLNPAFAGSSDNMTISAVARVQPLSGSDVTNELQQVSIETPIFVGSGSEKKLAGVGITLFNQTTGQGRSLKKMGAMLAISKPISFDVFGPQSLVVGVQGGIVRRSLDFSQLTWGSQFTPFLSEGFDPSIAGSSSLFEDNRTVAVINAGVMYQYNPQKDYLLYSLSFFSGISVTNINQPNVSFTTDQTSKEPLQLKYHGGFEYVLNGRYHLSPNLLVRYQNGSIETNVGSYLSIDFKSEQIQSFEDNIRIVGGIWYRLRDSFIFLVGISKQKYRLGFSYDLNKSIVGNKDRLETLQPAFELSLNYTLKSRQSSGRFSNPLF